MRLFTASIFCVCALLLGACINIEKVDHSRPAVSTTITSGYMSGFKRDDFVRPVRVVNVTHDGALIICSWGKAYAIYDRLPRRVRSRVSTREYIFTVRNTQGRGRARERRYFGVPYRSYCIDGDIHEGDSLGTTAYLYYEAEYSFKTRIDD